MTLAQERSMARKRFDVEAKSTRKIGLRQPAGIPWVTGVISNTGEFEYAPPSPGMVEYLNQIDPYSPGSGKVIC